MVKADSEHQFARASWPTALGLHGLNALFIAANIDHRLRAICGKFCTDQIDGLARIGGHIGNIVAATGPARLRHSWTVAHGHLLAQMRAGEKAMKPLRRRQMMGQQKRRLAALAPRKRYEAWQQG